MLIRFPKEKSFDNTKFEREKSRV